MNWGQFNGPLCHPCLPGANVACFFLIQETAGSNTIIFFTNNSTNSVEPAELIQENSNGELKCWSVIFSNIAPEVSFQQWSQTHSMQLL